MRVFFRPVFLNLVLAVILIAGTGTGCEPPAQQADPDGELFDWAPGECRLEDSISWGMFLPPPVQLPLQVYGLSKMSGNEKKTVIQALQVWDQFVYQQFGYHAFKMMSDNDPEKLNPVDVVYEPCEPKTLKLQAGRLVIRFLYDESRFQQKLPKDVWGVAYACKDQSGVPHSHTVEVLNIRQSNPYLLTILIHELGHVLGLGHSCHLDKNSNESGDWCSTVPAEHPVLRAVMFPSIRFSKPKETLGRNDKERLQCSLKWNFERVE